MESKMERSTESENMRAEGKEGERKEIRWRKEREREKEGAGHCFD